MREEHVRRDGACLQCREQRPEIAVIHGDPFCTTECAKVYHGVFYEAKGLRAQG